MSSQQRELVINLFKQINFAIEDIQLWNKDYKSSDELLSSSDGIRDLAATSMLLEAIGEGIKKIDSITDGKLLALRPEIPWRQVMGMRDHIAHGYFDIDADLIFSTVNEDLASLKLAVEFFIVELNK